jgi:hypothetical protein
MLSDCFLAHIMSDYFLKPMLRHDGFRKLPNMQPIQGANE